MCISVLCTELLITNALYAVFLTTCQAPSSYQPLAYSSVCACFQLRSSRCCDTWNFAIQSKQAFDGRWDKKTWAKPHELTLCVLCQYPTWIADMYAKFWRWVYFTTLYSGQKQKWKLKLDQQPRRTTDKRWWTKERALLIQIAMLH